VFNDGLAERNLAVAGKHYATAAATDKTVVERISRFLDMSGNSSFIQRVKTEPKPQITLMNADF